MDFINMFPPDRDPINLQDLVSFPQKAATLRCTAFHHPADHHAVHVVTHCRTLMAASTMHVSSSVSAK